MKLNKQFTAIVQKGPNKGDGRCRDARLAEYLGTRRLVEVRGLVGGHFVRTSSMVLGDGRDQPPIKQEMQRAIAKPGDRVTVALPERLEGRGH